MITSHYNGLAGHTYYSMVRNYHYHHYHHPTQEDDQSLNTILGLPSFGGGGKQYYEYIPTCIHIWLEGKYPRVVPQTTAKAAKID